MDEQSVTRSIPRSVGLLGTLIVAGLATLGLWSFVDSYLFDTGGEYFAPTIGILAITAAFVGGLVLLGARSRRWRAGPYW